MTEFPSFPRDPALEGHPLQHNYSFWFTKKSGKRDNQESYAKSIKYIGTVYSVFSIRALSLLICQIESFWAFYSHMKRPADLPASSDCHFFKYGIKPIWEVPKQHTYDIL